MILVNILQHDYENMVNLHQLTGRERFRFIGLLLKIRGETGSSVRGSCRRWRSHFDVQGHRSKDALAL